MATEQKSGQKKKPRGFAAVKQKYEDQIAELQRQLEAAMSQDPPAETLAPEGPEPVVVEASADDIPNYYEEGDPKSLWGLDPLRWINHDYQQIHLVGRLFGYRARRAINDQRGSQDKIYINALRPGEWHECPFDFSHPDPAEHQQRQILNKNHWLYSVSRVIADEVYSGIEGRKQSAVILPEEYEGLDAWTSIIIGRRRPCSQDSLRELIREMLQANPKTLWINGDYDDYLAAGHITKNRPSPYGKGVDDDTGAITMHTSGRAKAVSGAAPEWGAAEITT